MGLLVQKVRKIKRSYRYQNIKLFPLKICHNLKNIKEVVGSMKSKLNLQITALPSVCLATPLPPS